jgi:hypothetical protein
VEKLSSILPNSPRVKSVDLTEAKPRRPGAPSFGVPVGTTSTKDRVTMSSGTDEAAKELLTYKNPKDARGAKIAEDISRKFFETRLIKDDSAMPKAQAIAEEAIEAPSTFDYTPERAVLVEVPLKQTAE